MNILVLQNVAKQFFPVVLLVFVLVAFLGAGYAGMATDSRGQMSACPFSGLSALCQMNPLEHLTAWQSAFVASPQKDRTSFLILLALGVLAAFAVQSFFRSPRTVLVFVFVTCRRVNIFFFQDEIQEAFSNGILNPKIF